MENNKLFQSLDRAIFVAGIITGIHNNEQLCKWIKNDVSANPNNSLTDQYMKFKRNGTYVRHFMKNLIVYDRGKKVLNSKKFTAFLKLISSIDIEQHLNEINQICLDYARQEYHFIHELSRLNNRLCYRSAKNILLFLFDKSDKHEPA